MQNIKFENELLKSKTKTTPNSPSSNRKNNPKVTVEINKNDNIMSIRKKKL
jgi:hypothetical protein